jgi:hypothetical protein
MHGKDGPLLAETHDQVTALAGFECAAALSEKTAWLGCCSSSPDMQHLCCTCNRNVMRDEVSRLALLDSVT